MKVTAPLDRILDNAVKSKILRFLCKTNAEFNGRQIAKAIGVTPATAHKALQSLNGEGVLSLRNMGKTHVYTLNQNNFVVKNLLKPLFVREEEILPRIFTIIRQVLASSNVRKDIISVALFGSVSLQQDHSASDIDVVVVVTHAEVKSKVEKIFEKAGERIGRTFGNNLAPYLNTKREFQEKYRKGLGVIKNIIRSHKLIYGVPLEELV